ncbi:histidinol phosphate phosphatase domain-containing protein [Halobacteriota archaeon]
MIDLHTHTLFSDGELIPSELVRRATIHGYTAIGLADHVDFTNIDFVLKSLKQAKYLEKEFNIQVLVGVELTHLPPNKIEKLVKKARQLGAELIVVHGETVAEPVTPGTNSATVRTGEVDILAHPGLISIEDAETARENDIYLEITSRKVHAIANGHVAKTANETSAKLIVSTDSHGPNDLITREGAIEVAMCAGLDKNDADRAVSVNSKKLLERIIG